jgi:deazaflavin-dependent oxidoreductase (nitroreductase family)
METMEFGTAVSQSVIQHNPRIFPTENTNLGRLLSDSKYRSLFHARLKKYNPFVVALYKSGLLPLLGVGRSVMLLTTRGRKTGKTRITPIGYFYIGGVVHVFSAWGKQAQWYKNLIANPDQVTIQIGFNQKVVRPQVLEDHAEILCTLELFIAESPAQAKYLLGWDPEHDRIEAADFANIVNDVLIVRLFER